MIYNYGIKMGSSFNMLLTEARAFGVRIGQWVSLNWPLSLALLAAQFIAYSYLYTNIVFSDHILPNSWLSTYPSFKTLGEGRWMADLIIVAQGGSGVQAFQMFLASFLQAVNGLLFATFLGWKQRPIALLIGALICFYPAFFDYYGFAIDHICFVVGDSLCVIAAMLSLSQGVAWKRILFSSLLYGASLAIYGPKISLVAFFVGATSLLKYIGVDLGRSKISSHSRWLHEMAIFVSTLSLSVLIFWLSAKLTINHESAVRAQAIRTQVNELHEILNQMMAAYPAIFKFLMVGFGGIPPSLKLIPVLGIGLGIVALLLKVTGGKNKLACVVIIALMPFAIHLPWIINSDAWLGVGRLYPANAYITIFFMNFGLRVLVFRYAALSIMGLITYFWVILATQQSSAVMFKSIYETNFINRLVARLELASEASTNSPQPIVIAGSLPPFEANRFVKYPPIHERSHLMSSSFAPYRHVEILNFFAGREAYRRPTQQERDLALERLKDMTPWPDRNSVSREGSTLILFLQKRTGAQNQLGSISAELTMIGAD